MMQISDASRRADTRHESIVDNLPIKIKKIGDLFCGYTRVKHVVNKEAATFTGLVECPKSATENPADNYEYREALMRDISNTEKPCLSFFPPTFLEMAIWLDVVRMSVGGTARDQWHRWPSTVSVFRRV